jgi:hypothetical protein
MENTGISAAGLAKIMGEWQAHLEREYIRVFGCRPSADSKRLRKKRTKTLLEQAAQ